MTVRSLYIESARLTRPLLAAPAVGRRWDEPGALRLMTVGSVAGHLSRVATAVEAYLRTPAPVSGELIDAPDYYLSFEGMGPDIDSDMHRGIRQRAEREAAGGHPALLARWDRAYQDLVSRLRSEPDDRRIEVIGGRTLLLDDYLVTRLVEMLVHADDLAVSVTIDTPDYPAEAWRAVESCLVDVARRRHGNIAVVRALTRRERDDVEALRVL